MEQAISKLHSDEHQLLVLAFDEVLGLNYDVLTELAGQYRVRKRDEIKSSRLVYRKGLSRGYRGINLSSFNIKCKLKSEWQLLYFLIWADIARRHASLKIKVGACPVRNDFIEAPLNRSMGLDGGEEEGIAYIKVHPLGLQRCGRHVKKNSGCDGEDDWLLNHAHVSLGNDLPEAVDDGQL